MILRALAEKLLGKAAGLGGSTVKSRSLLTRSTKHVTEGFVDVPGGKIFFHSRDDRPNARSVNAESGNTSTAIDDSMAFDDTATFQDRATFEDSARPLIIIHGGPGFPHPYLLSLKRLAKDRRVVWYDQLGCGRSDNPDAQWCWSVPRFVAELEALRDSLGAESVNLLGHSWGTVVAAEYALAHPTKVNSLVLASPCLSLPLWRADAKRLGDTLPGGMPEALRDAEDGSGRLDSESYSAALAEYYARFVNRLATPPTELQESMSGAGARVYGVMWGPNERFVIGSLRDYDLLPSAGAIAAPTLVTCGRFDEATPETASRHVAAIPNALLAVFEESAHLPHITEEASYCATIERFLSDVERKTPKELL